MQQSKDIVIIDENGQNEININETSVKFDDLIAKSEQYNVKKEPKSKKVTFKQLQLSKKEQKIAELVEKQNTEPEREKLIYIIQKYQSSQIFGEYVQQELKINYSSESLHKKTVEQLESILAKIRLHLDNRNLDKIYDGVLFSSTMLIETFSRPMVNVDGFNKMLQENEQFLNCWERFKCESVMPTIPSHVQLMFILGQTYFMAYAMNQSKEEKEVAPEVQNIIDEVDSEIEENKKVKKEEKQENKEEIVEPKIENGMGI